MTAPRPRVGVSALGSPIEKTPLTAKILFIGHSAGRTGAPIILLNFLRWLKQQNDDVQFDVGLLDAGALMAEHQAIANTEVLRSEPGFAWRVRRRLFGSRPWEPTADQAFARRVRERGYDLVYVNTIVPKREILALRETRVPIVCHVHELDYAMMQWLGKDGLAPLVPCVTHFVAASVAVRNYLVSRWNVAESKVTVIHEFVLSDSEVRDSPDVRKRVRSSLGLSDDDILVGGCGSVDWRKGADLFVQVARFVTADPNGHNIHFVWVGADKATSDFRRFAHDIRGSGLDRRISVVENTPRPRDYFSAMDIFALTSREDPFPLVMLEAGATGLPLVCFEASGGGPEFAEADAGLLAPYLDVAAFANRVLSLSADPEARESVGGAARRKVAERYTIDQQAPKLRDLIMGLLRR